MRQLDFSGVFELLPMRREDERGCFVETYREDQFLDQVGSTRFVQDNHSVSKRRGVLRGLHYQLPPRPQAKLVRVIRGAILDVVVDIRRSSPDFGRWTSLELSADRWNQILIPAGFAHGFLTLQDDTEVVYKVSDFYVPHLDRAIRADDEELGIEWPVMEVGYTMSEKDRSAPLLRDAEVFP